MRMFAWVAASLFSSTMAFAEAAQNYNCTMLYQDKSVSNDKPVYEENFVFDAAKKENLNKAFGVTNGDDMEAVISFSKGEGNAIEGLLVGIINKKLGTAAASFFLPESFLMNVISITSAQTFYAITCVQGEAKANAPKLQNFDFAL